MENLEKVYEKLGNTKIIYTPETHEIVINCTGRNLMRMHIIASDMFGDSHISTGHTVIVCHKVDEIKYRLLLQRIDIILGSDEYDF